jgi:hypothetical protein
MNDGRSEALKKVDVSMAVSYKHTHIGYSILIPVLIVLILIGYLTIVLVPAFQWTGYITIILLIALVLFASLNVIIENNFLEIRFGIGLIRRKFPLDEYELVGVVKNPWYYGWGIRFISHGRLYNVSGSYAVEMRTKDGMVIRIGSDEPEKLDEAIKQSMIQ